MTGPHGSSDDLPVALAGRENEGHPRMTFIKPPHIHHLFMPNPRSSVFSLGLTEEPLTQGPHCSYSTSRALAIEGNTKTTVGPGCPWGV